MSVTHTATLPVREETVLFLSGLLDTGYAYLHEGIGVLAAHAPGLESVSLAAKMAGYAHVNIDGTLDRRRPACARRPRLRR